MSLSQLVQEIEEDKSQGKVAFSEALLAKANLTASDFDALLQSALLLPTPSLPVTIQSVTLSSSDVVQVVGSTTFLNMSDLQITLEVSLQNNANDVNVSIYAPLSKSWQFSDSFEFLTGYPFNKLQLSQQTYIFSTSTQTDYSWNKQSLSIQPGLNFAADLSLKELFPKILSFLPTFDLTQPLTFFGPIDPGIMNYQTVQNPDEAIVYPGMEIVGAISDESFKIGWLEVANPRISLEIVTEEETYSQFIWCSFVTDLEVDGTSFQFSSTIPQQAQGSYLFGIELNDSKISMADSITILMDGNSFQEVIPNELTQVFSQIDLQGFNLSVFLGKDLMINAITAMIGTNNQWSLSSEVVIDQLSLVFTVFNPLGTSGEKSTSGYFNAELTFLPDIFPGVFDIQIADNPAGPQISGRYEGAVKFAELIKDLSDGAVTLPSELNSVTFHNFSVDFQQTKQGLDYSLYSDASCDLSLLGHSVQTSLNLKIVKSATRYTYELTGGFSLAGNYFLIYIDFASQEKLLKAAWNAQSSQQELQFSDLAQAFGLSFPPLPSGLQLSLESVSFVYDFTNYDLVLTADSANYGQAVLVVFSDESADQSGTDSSSTSTSSSGQSGHAYFFGLSLGQPIDLADLPFVGKDFGALGQAGIDALQINVASAAIGAQQAKTINQLIKTASPASAHSATPAVDSGSSAHPEALPTVPAQGMVKGILLSMNLNLVATTMPLVLRMDDSASSTSSSNGTAGESSMNSNGASSESATSSDSPENPTPTAPDSEVATAPSSSSARAATPIPASTGGNLHWINVHKKLGPINFSQIGLGYTDDRLDIAFDISVSVSELMFSLDGLGIQTSLSEFDPSFSLLGLGIEFQSGEVSIEGSFLRQEMTQDGQTYDVYSGEAGLKFSTYSLSVVGSYTDAGSDPSLFLYGVLDSPIGGPSYFFITGLAAGFGYNRLLKTPKVDQVAQFPLVKQACSGIQTATLPSLSTVTAELNALQPWIVPDLGHSFLAVGIKFTTFDLIDSLALLVVKFGSPFAVDLLGVSTVSVPPNLSSEEHPPSPLAHGTLELLAQCIPSEGSIEIQGQLTRNSYVLTPQCHLTGGFAFAAWFGDEHAGEFVYSMGGYNPDFNAPSYYPTIPRLGFYWRVDDDLSIKGDAYYALTGAALMAGGDLEILFEYGPIKAWFTAGADFLIGWKPYHYSAQVHVDVGGSITFSLFGSHTISIQIGAGLDLWGPDFAGKVEVEVLIFSITISFGDSSPTLQPVSWTEFTQSFLPASDQWLSLTVQDGFLKSLNDTTSSSSASSSSASSSTAIQSLGVVNPLDAQIALESVIPVKSGEQALNHMKIAQQDLGIAPMWIVSEWLESSLSVTVTKDGTQPADDLFDFAPICKPAPTGLWGEPSMASQVNAPQFIDQAVFGVLLKPSQPPKPGQTQEIPNKNLKYETYPVNDPDWSPELDCTSPIKSAVDSLKYIAVSLSQSSTAREDLLKSLGFPTNEVSLDPEEIVRDFWATPQLGYPSVSSGTN